MIRALLSGLVVLVCVFAAPAAAQRVTFLETNDTAKTSDPAHLGYVFDQQDLPYPVTWQASEALCKDCAVQAAAYDKTMQYLMNTRYWITETEDRIRAAEEYDQLMRADNNAPPEEPLTIEDEEQEAKKLSYRLGLDDIGARLPALKAQEESLKSLGEELRAQRDVCEKRMCIPTVINPKEKPHKIPAQFLPFEWKGPYPEVCPACARDSAHLSGFPDPALASMVELEAARAEMMFAEMEILSLQIEHDGIGVAFVELGPDEQPLDAQGVAKKQDDFKKKTARRLQDMERKKIKAEEDIAKHETGLDSQAANFLQSHALYEQCTATCAQTEIAGPPVPRQQ